MSATPSHDPLLAYRALEAAPLALAHALGAPSFTLDAGCRTVQLAALAQELFVALATGELARLDERTGQLVERTPLALDDDAGPLVELAVCPLGRYAAALTDTELRVFDARTGRERARPVLPEAPRALPTSGLLSRLRWCPAGRYLTALAPDGPHLVSSACWDARDGFAPVALPPGSRVLCFDPRAPLAYVTEWQSSGSVTHGVTLHEGPFVAGARAPRVGPSLGRSRPVDAAALTRSGTYLLALREDAPSTPPSATLRCVDLAALERSPKPLAAHTRWSLALDFAVERVLVDATETYALALGDEVAVVALDTGALLARAWLPLAGAARAWGPALAFTPDARSLVGARAASLLRFETGTLRERSPLEDAPAEVGARALALAPSLRLAAEGLDDGAVRVWSLPEARAAWRLEGGLSSPATSGFFTYDERYLLACDGDRAVCFDLDEGLLALELPASAAGYALEGASCPPLRVARVCAAPAPAEHYFVAGRARDEASLDAGDEPRVFVLCARTADHAPRWCVAAPGRAVRELGVDAQGGVVSLVTDEGPVRLFDAGTGAERPSPWPAGLAGSATLGPLAAVVVTSATSALGLAAQGALHRLRSNGSAVRAAQVPSVLAGPWAWAPALRRLLVSDAEGALRSCFVDQASAWLDGHVALARAHDRPRSIAVAPDGASALVGTARGVLLHYALASR